jgi:hypothetical protein
MINGDIIRAAIQARNSQKITPANYQTFMPAKLQTQATLENDLTPSLFDKIKTWGETATQTVMQEQANKVALQQLRQAQQQRQNLRQSLNTAVANQPHILPPGTPGSNNPGGGIQIPGNQWGPDHIPEVSDLGRIRPNAPIVTRVFHGHKYQVNKQVAPIFQTFLRSLWQTGYRPQSIGGYSYRNIAGTNTRSLHSYGLAIDIDPQLNPVQHAGGHMQTSFPPEIRRLAAMYGLSWGGSWSSYKDPMHFSVPWGGRE